MKRVRLIGSTPSQLKVSLYIGTILWIASALRHYLLHSTGFDLGIYDQVAWQISRGFQASSTLLGLHHLGNHGAWAFYLIGLPYKIWPNIQWLLASQAMALSLTALPLAAIARQSGLKQTLSWLVCILWWLQPQVFNTNLFDFHPEVWSMPALAGAILFSRQNKPLPWFACLIWLLGCRDGLTLIVIGLGFSELINRRWRWGLTAIGLGFSWLIFLSEYLYPWINGNSSGPAALANFSSLGDSVPSILIGFVQQPWMLLKIVPWAETPFYLLLLTVPTVLFWRRNSLPILASALPLLMVNVLSSNTAQRDLNYHYNLSFAVIAVVASIDGLRSSGCQRWPFRRLIWTAICWATLAKPWFFTGHYLNRISQLENVTEAIRLIHPENHVLTSNYLAPQLTHRKVIHTIDIGPQTKILNLDYFDVVLLNPEDSKVKRTEKQQQIRLVSLAKKLHWQCKKWNSGLELCKNDSELK